jgi:hypothetical protein
VYLKAINNKDDESNTCTPAIFSFLPFFDTEQMIHNMRGKRNQKIINSVERFMPFFGVSSDFSQVAFGWSI